MPISSSFRAIERAPESTRTPLWIESGDISEYLDASELMDDDFASDILDVDAEAIEVQDDDGDDDDESGEHAISVEITVDARTSERKLSPRSFVLPPPRLPPRRPSMLSIPPSPMAQSVAPVALDVAPAKPATKEDANAEAAPAPKSHARFARPTVPWAVALLAVGAVAGFGASMLTQPERPPTVEAAAAAPSPAPPTEAAPANVVAPKAAPRAPEPTTLRFDTPLDIRVPAAVSPPAPAEPAAPPAKAAEPAKPVAKPAPKVEGAPKIFELPAREREKAHEQESTFVRAPTRPAPRRDLPPQAVDALVREQLSTALR